MPKPFTTYALYSLTLFACAGPQDARPNVISSVHGEAGQESPPEQAPEPRSDEQASVPEVRAPQVDFEDLADGAPGLPAISGDGHSVAVVEIKYDCCTDALRAQGRVLKRDGAEEAWVFVDDDESGASAVGAEEGSVRVDAFNRALRDQNFRTMASLDPSEADGVQVMSDRVVFESGEWMRPVLELSSHCRDGGLGEVEECRVPADVVGVWRMDHAWVVSTGRESQADGCSVSPTFHVVWMPAQ